MHVSTTNDTKCDSACLHMQGNSTFASSLGMQLLGRPGDCSIEEELLQIHEACELHLGSMEGEE